MTDKQLEYLLKIASEGNISKAAEKLFVSQSSLSQMLAHTEKELGVKIFDRSRTPLVPTYSGELFLSSAQKVLEIKRDLLIQYQEIEDNTSGQLHIGMAPSRSWLFVPNIIPDYMERFPNVELVFTEGFQDSLNPMLLDGKIDLILTVIPPNTPDIISVPIFTEQMFMIVPRAYALPKRDAGEKLELSAFQNIPFVFLRPHHDLRNITNKILSDGGFAPRVLLETDSMDVCLRLTATNLCATILPDSLYYFHEFKDRVRPIFTNSRYSRTMYISYKRNKYVPLIMQEFIRIAINNLQNIHDPSRLALDNLSLNI